MMDAGSAQDYRHVNMASSFKGPPMQSSKAGYKEYNTSLDPTTPSNDQATSSSFFGTLSEDFERILPGTALIEGATTSLQHNVEPDRPEISIQIRNVEHALQNLSEGTVASEITAHLSKLVPKIIRLERKVKMQSTLRGIFEEENQKLKSQVEQLKDEKDSLREENSKLQDEVVELKRIKEDDQLGEFDFVTKKEAKEIKDAETKEAEKPQTTASAGTISEETHFNLQRKYQCLKKQIEEIVKVNHSWDDHYRSMKAQLEAHIKDVQTQLDDAKNQTLAKQAGDEKIRIEKADKERAGALAQVVAVNQKCEKLERYARTLTVQRNEMEIEIKRLNEALAQKLKGSLGVSGGTHASQGDPPHVSSSSSHLQANDQTSQIGGQKVVHEMTEEEMREELDLLRQQTEVFQSDFIHERQDRQRVIGELDALQKELRRTKRQLKQHDQRNVMYEDDQFSEELQRGYQRGRPYSTSAPAHDYGYYVYKRPPVRYNQPMFPQDKSGRLIAHGKGNGQYNLAGNDMYIDGDTAMDGEPTVIVGYNQAFSDESNTPHLNQGNTRICPRCESSFDNDPDYHVHINACLED